MWVIMNFLGVIYIARNQQAFLAQMTSFVVQYDAIYLSFPIKSLYLMTGGPGGGGGGDDSPVHRPEAQSNKLR